MTLITLPQRTLDAVIDVSHHNGAIDWPAVAAAGVVLVFIKATQGTGFVDPRFAAYRRDAAAAGLMVVPYHFIDTSDPDDQADHFLDVTGLTAGYPAMIDWETAAPAESVIAFGEVLIDTAKRDPVAYYGCAQLHAAYDELSRWPLMLPGYPRGNTPGDYAALVKHPPRLPPGRATVWDATGDATGEATGDATPRPYHFHQYTPAGRLAGFGTPVDRSVWTGDLASLKTWYAGV